MSRVQASPMWKNNMSDVQASMLPPYLKDRRLYGRHNVSERPRCLLTSPGCCGSHYRLVQPR